MAGDEVLGLEAQNEEIEPIELEDLDIEALEESFENLEGDEESLSLAHKALDLLKSIFGGTEEPEDVEKALTPKMKNAIKGALRILTPYRKKEGAPAELHQACDILGKLLGYEAFGEAYGEKYRKPAKKAEVEKQAGALQNAVKALLAAFYKMDRADWDKLPQSIRQKVQALADAIGYGPYKKPEEYAKYPEVRKAVDEATAQLREELEKAQAQLAAMEEKARKAELVELSKSTGYDVDVLYRLEKLDPELFETITEHAEALVNRAKEAGLFKEIGTEAPAETKSLSQIMIEKAQEMVEKGEAKDFGSAIAHLSALPEFRDQLSELWENMPVQTATD